MEFAFVVQERLPMEMDAVHIVCFSHIEEVPVGELIGVHSQAFEGVDYAIDGLDWRENRTELIT